MSGKVQRRDFGAWKGMYTVSQGASGGLLGGGITGGLGRVSGDQEVGLFLEDWGKGSGLKGWIQP